jgi:HlyD family secretion protein
MPLIAALAIGAAAAGSWYAYRALSADVPKGRLVAGVGTVHAMKVAPVRSPIAGRIQEIKVDFRTPVKTGQVLARLDPATFQLRVDQARADLDAARAANAGAVIKQREALLRQAAADLERTLIRAPVDGTVVLRNVDVGQTVGAGPQASPLFTIAQDLHTVQIETAVAESDARRIRAGMPATFTVDALPRRSFSGEIRQIRKSATAYTALIAAANPDLALLPGMTANVRILPSP